GAQNLDLDGGRPPRRGGVSGGASEADGRDSATRLRSIGSARELPVLLLRPRFQAAQGTRCANFAENASLRATQASARQFRPCERPSTRRCGPWRSIATLQNQFHSPPYLRGGLGEKSGLAPMPRRDG